MDWNDDGLNDILVGEHNGRIKYYMAVTPDSLTEMEDIKADGDFINGGLVAAPVAFDWNNDSLEDLLVGYASPISGSTIKLYLNIGTSGNPILDAGTDVLCGGEPVGAYGCTPCVADLDQDGLTDIIYGEGPGRIYFCKNTGTAGNPLFAAPERLQDPSGDISVILNSSPFVADWNDDGFPDLIAGRGETGHVFAFLSPYTTGISSSSPGDPVFSASVLRNPVVNEISLEVVTQNEGPLRGEIYSIDGRLVETLDAGSIYPGTNTVSFPTGEHTQGVYLLRLSQGNKSTSNVITLIEGLR